MNKQTYALLFVIFFISCKNEPTIQSINEIHRNIVEAKILDKYKGHYVGPVTRGYDKIHIILPDSISVYVRGFDEKSRSNLRIVKYTNLRKQFFYELKVNPEDTQVLNLCHDLLSELTKFNIIALKKSHKCKCILIYTNITSPIASDDGKYVLIYDVENNIQNKPSCLFDNKGVITKISNNWYYYSSTRYSKYDKFH